MTESRDLRGLPFRVLRADPPYDRPRHGDDFWRREPDALPFGTVWLIPVETPALAWPVLEEWVPRLRLAFPVVPIALLILDPRAGRTITYTPMVAPLDIRAVVAADEPLAPSLRHQMTSPSDLGRDIVAWLNAFVAPMDHNIHPTLARLIDGATRHQTLDKFLGGDDRIRRAIAKRLMRRSLHSPGEWFGLGRSIGVALHLQRGPDTTVSTHAFTLGYEDASALRQRVRRAFGVPPSLVKKTVGWEWLVARWWVLRRTRLR